MSYADVTWLRQENKQLRLEQEILSPRTMPYGESRGLVRARGQGGPTGVLQFVSEHPVFYPVKTMRSGLNVSTGSYYNRHKSQPSARTQADQQLSKRIHEIYEKSNGVLWRAAHSSRTRKH